jgi:hypothetical protein
MFELAADWRANSSTVQSLQPVLKERNQREVLMPEQYRKFARECFKWAKLARTELERRDFIDMAEASMRAAAEHEGVPSWVGKPSAETRENRSDSITP